MIYRPSKLRMATSHRTGLNRAGSTLWTLNLAVAAAALSLAGCATTLSDVQDDETVIAVADAPAGALAAAQAVRPDVTFTEADIEVEDDVTTYEFAGETEDGVEIEVDVAENDAGEWMVLEIEKTIALSDVPQDVLDTLALQLPGFEPETVEVSKQGDMKVYEFEGVDATGAEIDVEVQSDGESIIVLDDATT